MDCPDLINAYRDTTERSTKMNGKRNKMFNKRKTSLCTGEEPPRKGAKEETSANGENEYEVRPIGSSVGLRKNRTIKKSFNVKQFYINFRCNSILEKLISCYFCTV